MTTETNVLAVPESRCYSRQVIESAVIVTDGVRQPGERDWMLVCLVRLT